MHQKRCGRLNLTDQEETLVTEVVFAFRCEIIEDRVFDQRTAESKDRVFDRGTMEDRDRVVDQRASGQSAKAPELATTEPGQSGVQVRGCGFSLCFRVVQNVRLFPKMDVFVTSWSAAIFTQASFWQGTCS